jgi:adenine phosphoribosyltransferase
MDLDKSIRKVKDHPKPGILFYDITSVLANPEAFAFCIESMIDLYKGSDLSAVAAVEARGFLFAAPFALRAGLPLILVRKKGKLPGKTMQQSFQLEYGEDVVEILPDDIPKKGEILLVDDLIATGGTLEAAAQLIEKAGGQVKDIFGVIGLPFLEYGKVLKDWRVRTLIDYDSE